MPKVIVSLSPWQQSKHYMLSHVKRRIREKIKKNSFILLLLKNYIFKQSNKNNFQSMLRCMNIRRSIFVWYRVISGRSCKVSGWHTRSGHRVLMQRLLLSLITDLVRKQDADSLLGGHLVVHYNRNIYSHQIDASVEFVHDQRICACFLCTWNANPDTTRYSIHIIRCFCPFEPFELSNVQ